MRKYFIGSIVLAAISLLLFLRKGETPDSPPKDVSQQAADVKGEEGISASTTSSEPSHPAELPSAPEKPQPTKSYDSLFLPLGEKLGSAGFSYQVSECLEEKVKSNLKRDPPHSIEGIAVKCGEETSLSDREKELLISIFKQAIAESHGRIETRDWHDCAKKHVFQHASRCLQSVYKSAVDSFAEEMLQVGESFPKDDFQKKWQERTSSVLNRIVAECPEDINYLNEAMAYECI